MILAAAQAPIVDVNRRLFGNPRLLKGAGKYSHGHPAFS